jgi:ribonuclease VapC
MLADEIDRIAGCCSRPPVRDPRGADGLRELDRRIEKAGIEFVGVDREQGRMARDAFSRFGKGRHRPGFNLGNCFAYALASVLQQPLLHKGGNFDETDLVGP